MSKYGPLKFLVKNKWIFLNSKYFEMFPYIQTGVALFLVVFCNLLCECASFYCALISVFSMIVVSILLAVLWNIYYKKKELICRFCGASNVGNTNFCIKCYRLIDEDYNYCREDLIKCPVCNKISEVSLDRCIKCNAKVRRIQ